MGDDGGTEPDDTADDARAKPCEQCGMVIDTGDWYPVAKERDADGSLRFYPFCSEDCRAAWREGRSE